MDQINYITFVFKFNHSWFFHWLAVLLAYPPFDL
jgi:hypothetical protein